MPNRYVREGAIDSEAVNSLSWRAEVFYRRLINRVDDFGRYTAHPELLRSSVFPLQLAKVSAADIAELLLECEHAGLVSCWAEADGKRYLVLHKSDRGRAKTSKYPTPPASIDMRLQTSAYGCQRLRTDSLGTGTGTGTDSDYGTGTDRVRARAGAAQAPPDAEEPSLDEVCRAAELIGLARWCAEDFHADFSAVGWQFRGQQVRNWRALLNKKLAWWRADGAPANRPTKHGNSQKPHRNDYLQADPDQGQQIADIVDRQYREWEANRADQQPAD